MALLWGAWFPNVVSLLFHSHAASIYGPPATLASSPPRTLCNVQRNVVSTGRKSLRLSFVEKCGIVPENDEENNSKKLHAEMEKINT